MNEMQVKKAAQNKQDWENGYLELDEAIDVLLALKLTPNDLRDQVRALVNKDGPDIEAGGRDFAKWVRKEAAERRQAQAEAKEKEVQACMQRDLN